MADTPIDAAHAAMQADINDEAARLAFYEKLAGSELFLLLESEVSGDQINPEVFELPDDSYVVAFDREDRLSQFTGRMSPYAALSGRTICQMLAPNSLGIGLNLDVAPSSILIPPDAVSWLSRMESTPERVTQGIERLSVPNGLPDIFLKTLDARLAAAEGLADLAYLVGVTYENGSVGHLVGFVNAPPMAQGALVRTVAQALVFSGLEVGAIDVGFFDPTDPTAAKLAKWGLRFDLPQPRLAMQVAPGSDPEKPPILR